MWAKCPERMRMDVLYGAALGGIFGFLMILGLIIGVITLISMWKLFVKAGYAGCSCSA